MLQSSVPADTTRLMSTCRFATFSPSNTQCHVRKRLPHKNEELDQYNVYLGMDVTGENEKGQRNADERAADVRGPRDVVVRRREGHAGRVAHQRRRRGAQQRPAAFRRCQHDDAQRAEPPQRNVAEPGNQQMIYFTLCTLLRIIF